MGGSETCVSTIDNLFQNKMSRNRKQNSADRMESTEENLEDNRVFKENFFVPAHPILFIAIVYGLFLTFASAICPQTCLSMYLPLGSFASMLGKDYSTVMIVIAVGAGLAHVGEALYCLHLTKNKHKMKKNIILLWTLNVFFVGIFGFWILLWPEYFLRISSWYCKIPASFCLNH